jgi:hypothetical protein
MRQEVICIEALSSLRMKQWAGILNSGNHLETLRAQPRASLLVMRMHSSVDSLNSSPFPDSNRLCLRAESLLLIVSLLLSAQRSPRECQNRFVFDRTPRESFESSDDLPAGATN